jgi:hypothetical protein
MGTCVTGDGCTSDKDCEGCDENIGYGEDCVLLRLVYPAKINGSRILLDALEDDGSYTADPLLYCFSCWGSYADNLRILMSDLFVMKVKGVNPSGSKCAYCFTNIGDGDYCCHARYGTLDTSARTKETTFEVAPHETVLNAELICMDCLERINELEGENIWDHLYMEDHEEST